MCNPAADRVCLNCEDWARSPFKTVFGIDESRARWVEIAPSSYPLRRCPQRCSKPRGRQPNTMRAAPAAPATWCAYQS